MENKPKMKKVACKTVIAKCDAKIKEAKQTQAMLDKWLKTVESEWIPTINKELRNALSLRKKALDISIDQGEEGMMDVAVNAGEGEQVNVQDNTQSAGGDEFSTGDTGAPVDVMSNEDMTKTFMRMQQDMAKLAKALENKTNKK